MYKLIIVDDEAISRTGLQQIIDWKSLGFNIVCTFEDGADTIEYIKNNEVDAILSDISMAEVSGIELAEYVHKNYPNIKMVFMSAYKEFEYAQYAVQYSVVDYIVKPFSLEEVKLVFKRIYEQLKMRENDNLIKERYIELIREKKQDLFIDLTMGVISDIDEFTKRMALIDSEINARNLPCSIMNLTIDEQELDLFLKKQWIYGIDTFSQALMNFLNFEENRLDYYIVDQQKGNLLLFVFCEQELKEFIFENQLKNEIKTAIEGIKGILGIEVKIHIGDIYESVTQYFLDGDINSNCPTIVKKWDKDSLDLSKFKSQENQLISYLLCNELDSCKVVFEKMLRTIDSFGQNVTLNFLIKLLNKLKAQELLPQSYKIELPISDIDYSEVVKLTKFEEKMEWGIKLFETICKENYLATNEGNNFSQVMIINKAKQYIDNHFASDISLNDVAEHVYLSAVYFSRLFKEIEGINYIDYIIKARIDKSQMLLNNPTLKIYEISEMVGYQSVRYFYKMYKNSTGETPTQYRQRIMNNLESFE